MAQPARQMAKTGRDPLVMLRPKGELLRVIQLLIARADSAARH